MGIDQRQPGRARQVKDMLVFLGVLWVGSCTVLALLLWFVPALHRIVRSYPSTPVDVAMPHAKGAIVLDQLTHPTEGSTRSCSLWALYAYALRQTGRTYSPTEFAAFREWAIRNRWFNPTARVGEETVQFKPLAAQINRYFPGVRPLTFDTVPRDNWPETVAHDLASGHLVLMMTSLAPTTTRKPDHILTVVDVVRDRSGALKDFVVFDPAVGGLSPASLDTTTLLPVSQAAASLGPAPGIDNQHYVTIMVSHDVAWRV